MSSLLLTGYTLHYMVFIHIIHVLLPATKQCSKAEASSDAGHRCTPGDIVGSRRDSGSRQIQVRTGRLQWLVRLLQR